MTSGVRVNMTNEMHLLMHFRVLPEAYTQKLLGHSYEYYDPTKKRYVSGVVTRRAIEESFRVKGKSRFFLSVPGLETPRAVIELVKKEAEKRPLRWTDRGEYRTAKFSFMYPVFVGNDIPERSKRKTHRIGVELSWYKEKDFCYMTAYPCA